MARDIHKEHEQAKAAVSAARIQHIQFLTEETGYTLALAQSRELKLDVELRCHGRISKEKN